MMDEEVEMRNRTRWMIGAVMAVILLLGSPLIAAPAPPDGEEVEAIDINTADVEELMELPGVGPAYAERIVAYREENGPFESVEEIMNVRGIGEKTFLRIRDRIRVGKVKEGKGGKR
jgi:competence ComEA-like helix-hairpin-helix protein